MMGTFCLLSTIWSTLPPSAVDNIDRNLNLIANTNQAHIGIHVGPIATYGTLYSKNFCSGNFVYLSRLPERYAHVG